MNKTSTAIALLAAASLAGCAAKIESPNLQKIQMIQLDSDTSLGIMVSGAQTSSAPVASVLPGPRSGDPVHRFIKSSDGRVLFAYDLQLNETNGSYTALLKPAVKGPTFAATREIAIPNPPDTVQVELMEQQGTGRKVVDQLRIFRGQSFHSRLMAMHNQFYHWVHGE